MRATFEGYVRDPIKSGALVSVLDDWCPPFPGPFLYYPSRRQPPPALAAFVAFVADWRKQERKIHRRPGHAKREPGPITTGIRICKRCGRNSVQRCRSVVMVRRVGGDDTEMSPRAY
jgi:hypothetical protein